MDSLNGTWEAGNAEPVAGNEALGRKTNTGITALYSGDSGATTDEVPVMGMERRTEQSNSQMELSRQVSVSDESRSSEDVTE